MSCHPAIGGLVQYGTEAEEKLTAVLSDIVGETIKKTLKMFDVLDFQGSSTFAELKRRSSDYFYTDAKIKEEGWYVPSCKIIRGWDELSQGKRVLFFYLWMKDKSLWVYEMQEGDFSSNDCHKIPRGHYDNQLHVAIKEDQWCRCDADLSKIIFEEETCLIV